MSDTETSEIKFSVGETVLYRRYGVCKISSAEERTFGDSQKLYYTLEPVFAAKATKFYVPADADSLDLLIRRIFDKKQLTAAVNCAKDEPLLWINSAKERLVSFEELMKTGSLADMVRLARALREHKLQQKAIGRHFIDCDRRILAAAEKLVSDELVYVFGIDRDEALNRIYG
ncbi:MAG: CarD family transcriptional regulator [Synergistaceae bacterium]|nr:CarD family transcriptional regulator [Synergistaceae bacterium]